MGMEVIMRLTPLNQLQAGKISKADAYTQWQLNEQSIKKARFVKLRIYLRDQKAVSVAINTLFMMPFPLALAKPFLRKIKDPQVREIVSYIQYAKGTRIDVQSKDAIIRIAII